MGTGSARAELASWLCALAAPMAVTSRPPMARRSSARPSTTGSPATSSRGSAPVLGPEARVGDRPVRGVPVGEGTPAGEGAPPDRGTPAGLAPGWTSPGPETRSAGGVPPGRPGLVRPAPTPPDGRGRPPGGADGTDRASDAPGSRAATGADVAIGQDTVGRDTVGRDTVGRDTVGRDVAGWGAARPLSAPAGAGAWGRRVDGAGSVELAGPFEGLPGSAAARAVPAAGAAMVEDAGGPGREPTATAMDAALAPLLPAPAGAVPDDGAGRAAPGDHGAWADLVGGRPGSAPDPADVDDLADLLAGVLEDSARALGVLELEP